MKNPYAEDDVRERLRNAVLTGLGTTTALAAGQSSIGMYRDAQENKMKYTRGLDDFMGKLKPGDVLFHRRPTKWSGKSDLGPFELPIKETDVMIGAKGDQFYHASIYGDKGRGKRRGLGTIYEAADWEKGVTKSPITGDFAEEIKAYRPKGQTPETRRAAIDYLKKRIGTQYKEAPGVIAHGLTHHAGIRAPSKQICGLGPGGKTVCTELVAEAYPKIFKDRFMSPMNMRHSKDMELIARYGANVGKNPLKDAILSRALYPLLRNAKWGLLAGAGAYGLQSIGDSK